MPREYGKAWFSMFTDDHFTAQPNLDKFLYMTPARTAVAELRRSDPDHFKRCASRAGWRSGAVRAGGEGGPIRLERNDYVFSDDETGEVLVRSFMRRNEVFSSRT
ncbi:hypothetical protein GS438_24100 [Rhodococcus hoagii]|nr:hypothetical protein [Prescottella equi]